MTSVRDSAVLGLQGAELATVEPRPRLGQPPGQGPGAWPSRPTSTHRLTGEGVRIVAGQGRLSDEVRGLAAHRVEVLDDDGAVIEELEGDVVLIATGADPRVLPGAEPDGERILDWRDVYELEEMPEHLVVVGSGVTGAEFASGYLEAGVPVTLVSSRDRVLPGEDADAAEVLEEVFQSRGGRIAERGRAATVTRTEKGVLVELTDGRTVEGSHALMTVGTVPNTGGLNLEQTGVEVRRPAHRRRPRLPHARAGRLRRRRRHRRLPARLGRGHAGPDRDVARPRRGRGADQAQDGRRQRLHPSRDRHGRRPGEVDHRRQDIDVVRLPLATNARAKMSDLRDGFVKLFTRRSTGVVIGGVVVAPGASELMLPIALAVTKGLTVADLAQTFAIYPSLSGSITEAGRRLMGVDELS